jgi:2-dehydro-3-deoxygluconokinase
MLLTFGETMLRYGPPEGERLETADELRVHVGGAESNVAAAAARLGVDAVWASVLPDSPLGRRIETGLRRHGVDVDVTWSDRGRVGTYYVETGGAPRGTDIRYDRDGAAVRAARPADLGADRLDAAEVVHTSGITPALSDRLADSTRELLAAANDAGATVSFDLNYRSKLWSPEDARERLRELLGLADVLTVAKRDAETVLGRGGGPVEVANGIAGEFGAETVLLTLSAAGAVAVHDGTVHEQDAFATDTVDAIGSGDAFVGGFLASRLRGGDVPAALSEAAATAALKRTVAGDVAVVTPAEVAAVVEGEEGDISR